MPKTTPLNLFTAIGDDQRVKSTLWLGDVVLGELDMDIDTFIELVVLIARGDNLPLKLIADYGDIIELAGME